MQVIFKMLNMKEIALLILFENERCRINLNTIKLNQILKNDVPIEQIDFFFQKQNKKSHKKQATDKAQTLHITNDQEARHYMKQFIVIMSLHCGFVGK